MFDVVCAPRKGWVRSLPPSPLQAYGLCNHRPLIVKTSKFHLRRKEIPCYSALQCTGQALFLSKHPCLCGILHLVQLRVSSQLFFYLGNFLANSYSICCRMDTPQGVLLAFLLEKGSGVSESTTSSTNEE